MLNIKIETFEKIIKGFKKQTNLELVLINVIDF